MPKFLAFTSTQTGMRVPVMQASPPQTPGVLLIPRHLLLILRAHIWITSAFSAGVKASSCVSNSLTVIGTI